MSNFPIRCFTCNAILKTWDTFVETKHNIQRQSKEELLDGFALDVLGITRGCCRRMYITFIGGEEKYQDSRHFSMNPGFNVRNLNTFDFFNSTPSEQVVIQNFNERLPKNLQSLKLIKCEDDNIYLQVDKNSLEHIKDLPMETILKSTFPEIVISKVYYRVVSN